MFCGRGSWGGSDDFFLCVGKSGEGEDAQHQAEEEGWCPHPGGFACICDFPMYTSSWWSPYVGCCYT